MVGFSADVIRDLTEEMLPRLGLDPDAEVKVEVDETTPVGWADVTSLDPVTLAIESGALEDPKRPRQLSEPGSQNVIGRLLLQAGDRLDPAFGAPPLDEPLALPLANAWDTYCAGRLHSLGYRYYDQYQRRLYTFRNRHGFSDRGDAVFERLWNGDGLTWADLTALSEEALVPQ